MLDQFALQPQETLLIRQVARGNPEAFERLYDHYELPVFTYLCRLGMDEGSAEEVLQEVFLAVWKGASGFRGQSSVKTWLFHIAHNQAVSWYRKHRGCENLDEFEVVDEREGPEGATIQSWKSDQIRQALDTLSPDHRAVLELIFYCEMSLEEISAVMGCPLGTVKSRACYARRHLEGWLRRHSDEEDLS